MPEKRFDFEAIVKILLQNKVDFIVVGGICAALHGSDTPTQDIDIVQSRAPDNLKRLESALSELGAYYREHTNKRLIPKAERMTTGGHHLLNTAFGPVDVLGAIANQRDYPALLPHTIEIELEEDMRFRTLDLSTLILTKQETGREKDRRMLPILLRIQEELERR